MSDQTDPTVRLERDGAVATVVIDRPRARNALDRPTKEALLAVLDEVASDDGVRAVVLTGAGGSFCGGQDLAEHAAALEADASTALDTVREHYSPIVTLLATMPKPVVAAVQGACVGAGLGLALACDVRVLADDARLATAFTGIGLTFDSGLASSLARSVGESRARELILLGAPLDAATAVAWGIAGEVVASDEVPARAHELAVRLAQGPTLAFAASKRLLADGATRTLAETLEAEATAQVELGVTDDHRDAVTAFLGKQRPTFRGR